mgnify:CR=1 FL=1
MTEMPNQEQLDKIIADELKKISFSEEEAQSAMEDLESLKNNDELNQLAALSKADTAAPSLFLATLNKLPKKINQIINYK